MPSSLVKFGKSHFLTFFQPRLTLSTVAYDVSNWCVQHQKLSAESLLHDSELFLHANGDNVNMSRRWHSGQAHRPQKSPTADVSWRTKESNRGNKQKQELSPPQKMITLLAGYINNSSNMQHHNLFPSNESASLPFSNSPLADSLPPLYFSPRELHTLYKSCADTAVNTGSTVDVLHKDTLIFDSSNHPNLWLENRDLQICVSATCIFYIYMLHL